jgi:hypothetical protein
MTATELLLRDSLQIETAKTAREMEYVIRNIEARHAVEGISDADLAAWENLKAQHAERICRVVTA